MSIGNDFIKIDDLEKAKDGYLSILNSSNDHFEKQISYISAGSLGLSFIILEKVFKDISSTEYKALLISGWFFLGVTLFVNLLSHKVAIDCHYNTIQEIGEHIKLKQDYSRSNIKRRKALIERYNNSALILLFLGICSILLYTSINIMISC